MTTAGKAYIVRDAEAGAGPRAVTQVYPYTLQGLAAALADARTRSLHGAAQVVVVMTNGKSKVIRRFEDGHDVTATT